MLSTPSPFSSLGVGNLREQKTQDKGVGSWHQHLNPYKAGYLLEGVMGHGYPRHRCTHVSLHLWYDKISTTPWVKTMGSPMSKSRKGQSSFCYPWNFVFPLLTRINGVGAWKKFVKGEPKNTEEHLFFKTLFCSNNVLYILFLGFCSSLFC